jgi:ABC-type Fe3+-siderophore transport system permease subunit
MRQALGVSRLARHCAPLLSLLLATLVARAAPAEPADDATRGAARTLGTSGVSAYLKGDYTVAKEQLERSFDLFPIPTLGLWSARALSKVGLLVEAAERYRQVSLLRVEVGDVAIQRAAQASAERERNELVPLIPGLTFRLVGAKAEDVQVAVDGAELDGAQVAQGVAVNPGRHQVTGQRGDERISNTLELLAGQRQEVELRFVELAPPSPAPGALPLGSRAVLPEPAPRAPQLSSDASTDTHRLSRTAGWVGVGLGAAGIGTGVVAYFVGLSKHDAIEADPRCSGNVCQPEASEKVEHYDTVRTVSIVGLIAGGALGAAGITLLVLSREPSADVTVTAAGSSLALRGSF